MGYKHEGRKVVSWFDLLKLVGKRVSGVPHDEGGMIVERVSNTVR